MAFAEITLGQSLLLLLSVSVSMAWTWTLFICVADLFRDPRLAGWRKALWTLLLLVPLLGCLLYLAARGSQMEARAIRSRQELMDSLDGK